ncbi:hypothetical protein HBB16_21665 [Pseudonocardia sp. MCCB 268]|nr:hypothetical protein [Pseudonocardia cytotoxica]
MTPESLRSAVLRVASWRRSRNGAQSSRRSLRAAGGALAAADVVESLVRRPGCGGCACGQGGCGRA